MYPVLIPSMPAAGARPPRRARRGAIVPAGGRPAPRCGVLVFPSSHIWGDVEGVPGPLVGVLRSTRRHFMYGHRRAPFQTTDFPNPLFGALGWLLNGGLVDSAVRFTLSSLCFGAVIGAANMRLRFGLLFLSEPCFDLVFTLF